MTQQKTFKRRVRARMAKTGESYTAARRRLIADGGPPAVPTPPPFEPPLAEERLAEATGHGWDHWLAVLDEWGATGRNHTEIARFLMDEQAVAGWYAQSITVGYERARGMRAKGQNKDGFVISVSKTVAVPRERLFAAFEDPELRERWLPGAEMGLRTATPPRLARWDWEDGSTRIVLGIEAVDAHKSRLGLNHEKLPDADTAEEMRLWWRERVQALKELLEEGSRKRTTGLEPATSSLGSLRSTN